jgi:FkbM family methyltransferase
MFSRRARLFRLFRAGNQFEVNNVVVPIVFQDEYQIEDLRFDPRDIVVDIGAHIGVFSYLCYIQGSRALYCYEPGKRNFHLLERNLGFLPGVHLFSAAVWRSDTEGSPDLILSVDPDLENTGMNSVLASGHVVEFWNQHLLPSSGGDRVASVPLDAILERFDRVTLLKLDCEGSEFPILLTSRQLHKVERIIGEVHELDAEVMELLDPHSRVPGYTTYRVEDLVAKLEPLGFHVRTRGGRPHLYYFDARRP